MNPSNTEISPKDREIFKLFYTGGLQKYIPRDESKIYMNNLFLDSIKFCLKDFSSKTPSKEEKECMSSFYKKNFQLLTSNL